MVDDVEIARWVQWAEAYAARASNEAHDAAAYAAEAMRVEPFGPGPSPVTLLGWAREAAAAAARWAGCAADVAGEAARAAASLKERR